MSDGFQSDYAGKYKKLMSLVLQKYGNKSDI